MERTTVVEVEGQAIYALQPQQMKALDLTPLRRPKSEHGPRFIGYGGAAGGGKSHLARAIAFLVALRWPGSTTIIFRKTYPEVRDNHIVKVRQEVPSFGDRFYALNTGEGVLELSNGSRILFGYLQRNDHVFRYQGNEYDCMIFEEATHYTWFQVNWLISNRLRATTDDSVPFVLFPTNPGNVGHFWFRRLFIDKRYEASRGEFAHDYAFVPARVEDNAVLLDRDPNYLANLRRLPEPYRSWYLFGDFEAGAGQALALSRDAHLVPLFPIPAHWKLFGGHDWGFQHPFAWGLYASDDQGNVFCIDTITGRHLQDHEIIERVAERRIELCDMGVLHSKAHMGTIVTAAGHDVWTERRAKAEGMIPTSAETYTKLGWPVEQANIARIAGLKNLRAYLDFDLAEKRWPKFRMLATPANEKAYDALESMVSDPDNIEDVLKVDADDFGEGGDDTYDEKRYALASRPLRARQPKPEMPPPTAENRDTHLERMIQQAKEAGRRGTPNRRAPVG